MGGQSTATILWPTASCAYTISPIHTPLHRPMAPYPIVQSKSSCFGDIPIGTCKLQKGMKHADVTVKGEKIVDAVTWVRNNFVEFHFQSHIFK